MANLYKKNMEAFRYVNPMAREIFDLLEREDLNVISLKDGNLYFENKNIQYRLYSCNKEEETRRILMGMNRENDNLIVLFGMGNIHLLNTLNRETTEETRIMVIEPNLAICKYMMKQYNLVELMEKGKLMFICGTEEMIDIQFRYCISIEWDNLVQNIKILSLGNYHVYSEFRKKCVNEICGRIQISITLLGNSLEDILEGLEHHFFNVDASIRTNGVHEIKNKFKGCPAVIVASGPSLDKNIKFLKEVQDKALILSCDASMEACKSNGVKPDIVASIERVIETYQYFYEGKRFDEDLILVAPSILWPDIYEVFPGKIILMEREETGVEKWWSSHFKNEEFQAMGLSCAGTAYAFAKEAGCEPIILIGQDLAYTNERIHSDSAHTEFEGENTINKEDAPSSEIWTEDINGKPIRTSDLYNMFRFFYEEQFAINNRRLIDATEGGAKIKGAEIMTFREAIDTCCTKRIEVRPKDLLENIKITNQEYIDKYDEIIISAKDMIEELKTIKKMATDYFTSIKRYWEWDNPKASEKEMLRILEAMQPANDIVDYIRKDSKVVTFYQQVLKQTIIYVRKIGNGLTPEGIKRNLELQFSLMNMLEAASIVTIECFEKMVSLLEEKKEKRMHVESEI